MRNTLRKPLYATYQWCLSIARSPYGMVVLIMVAISESIFFFVPPDILIIAMVLANKKRWWHYASIATLCSVVGGLGGYAIGYYAFATWGQDIITIYHGQMLFEKFQTWYDTYGSWAVLIAGFTPVPYKIATICSGVFHMPLDTFVITSFISRGLRFFIIALLMRLLQAKAKILIEKHLGWLTIVLALAVIGGFIVMKG